ncbi:spore germination protein [Pelotomaculum terephthalicicum JT]|uniref:GerAB/ArcD/ProY family transporter n=1 Tax=Pelotomaculum TaxID=191373 RepID=UPI0009C546AD|nr:MULTISPECIES: endospore germination permease [Pelotomaculum]MCG9968639.1 spore germination protein [Pelotomaculum terephthalicicum JT]OPX85263.1 MAG: Spore germination protein YndE [Pelotomaculum sp. PtaB.Bin117]OPY62584.1 MAG: Spore germination protein YndE [Pelotomaculum sp. PtaU1.Bin065]
MLEEGRISNRQAAFLVITTILSTTSIGFLPSMIYQEAAQDSWISILLLTVYGIVVGRIIMSLGMRFPDKTIVEYAEIVTGRIPGKIIGFLYVLFFLYLNTFPIRFFGELSITFFMPETPLVFFLIGIIFAAAYAVRSGLEVIARANEIILPVSLTIGIILAIMLFPQMEIKNFIPVLEKGILPVFKGTYVALVYFAETIVMVMFIPYLNTTRRTRGIIFKSFVVISLCELLAVVSTIAVLGELAARIPVPAIFAARLVSLAELIERVEPLFLLLWVIAVFVKVSVFYYCFVLATAQWLNLKEYKALVLPAGVLLTVLSVVLWGNIADLYEQMVKLVPYFVFVEAVLPLVLLVAACLRGKGGTAGEN